MFLLATLGGVAEVMAVGTLGGAVCLDHLLNFEALREEEEAGEEVLNVFGVNGDNQRILFLGLSKIAVLVQVPGRSDRDRFRILD